MILRTLALAAVLAPAALAQPTLVPGGGVLGALAYADGHFAYVATDSDHSARLGLLDPETGHTTETPLVGPAADALEWGVWALGGRFYASAATENGDRAGLYVLDPASGRTALVSGPLAGASDYELSVLREAEGRVFWSQPTETGPLREIGPDGTATALEPTPTDDVRTIYDPTPIGDAVYYVVEVSDEAGDHRTLWRSAGGTAAPVAVPAEAAGRALSLASVDGALLLAASDDNQPTSWLWRMQPGGSFQPIPAFETRGYLPYGLFRGLGDVLVLSAPDADGRTRLFRQRGNAAPEKVEGLDLGEDGRFIEETVRAFDGALYAWGFTDGDDPYGTPTTLFRVDAEGPARPVARYAGDGFLQVQSTTECFVVAGGRVYVRAFEGDADDVALSLPLTP